MADSPPRAISPSEIETVETSGLPKITPRERFSYEEDRTMLMYIIDKKRFNDIKGRKLWEDMEYFFANNRTWQALSQRFNKHVILKLQKYDISEDDTKLLLQAYTK